MMFNPLFDTVTASEHDWFYKNYTPEQQKEYIDAHPNSLFAKRYNNHRDIHDKKNKRYNNDIVYQSYINDPKEQDKVKQILRKNRGILKALIDNKEDRGKAADSIMSLKKNLLGTFKNAPRGEKIEFIKGAAQLRKGSMKEEAFKVLKKLPMLPMEAGEKVGKALDKGFDKTAEAIQKADTHKVGYAVLGLGVVGGLTLTGHVLLPAVLAVSYYSLKYGTKGIDKLTEAMKEHANNAKEATKEAAKKAVEKTKEFNQGDPLGFTERRDQFYNTTPRDYPDNPLDNSPFKPHKNTSSDFKDIAIYTILSEDDINPDDAREAIKTYENVIDNAADFMRNKDITPDEWAAMLHIVEKSE